MNLKRDFNIIYNLKKIGRIMRKYNIVCPHRKPNKYKQIAKATKEHSTLSNTLNREFKQEIPRKDHLELKKCNNLEEVKKKMKRFVNYYNNHRYQWNLKKMTPVEYRNHLLLA